VIFEEFLSQYGQRVNFGKGGHIFHQGEPEVNLYFVKKGLLKAYYLTEEGKEFVKSFVIENDLIGSLYSSQGNKLCSFNLICLEDCELVSINFELLRERAANDVGMANSLINFLVQLGMKKEKREYEFLCLNAAQRYDIIRKEKPELLSRVTQNDIARYLGITPVALSRIRGRRH